MMIKRFGDGRDWFFKQRFGMFVHWGIYSVAGWQEQMHWRGHMLSKDYVIFKDQFNPVKYPMIQRSPMVTPGHTVTPPPSQQSSPMVIGEHRSMGLRRST